MNKQLERFLQDNNIKASNLSTKVLGMMNPDSEEAVISSSVVKSVGGYLRRLTQSSVENMTGGTVLPSEYFGVNSKSYFADVGSVNYNDANPQFTRVAIPSTFKGGAKKEYKFLSVAQMKKYYKNANKQYTQAINQVLANVFRKSIKGGSITQKSLKEAFNN